MEDLRFTILGSGPSPFPFLRFLLRPPLSPEPPLALACWEDVVCIDRGFEVGGDNGKDVVATAAALGVESREELGKRLERGALDGSLVKRPRNVGVNMVASRSVFDI